MSDTHTAPTADTVTTTSSPAPGDESPFSIFDIARTAARRLGTGWTATAGTFGVSGTIESPDGRSYLVKVGNTGNMDDYLYVQYDDDHRVLEGNDVEDGLTNLADTVSITVRLMHYAESTAAPWDAGNHLVAAFLGHGRRTRIDNHSAGTCIILDGHNGHHISISGASQTKGDLRHDYAPDDHESWTAVLCDPDDNEIGVIYQTDAALTADFAQDTALLLTCVLPGTATEQTP
ncbi:hypothetical protein [Streptomyces sp. AP-93]|uniref:hypothetical protein n=1 Tax=Streptomyces sp. AP-93 TaxID=2929048 RepID=UPI001FAFCACF|nr:hypothetical protein [Streptomyces sp. AP-93]MCJ0875632.1 hypothetical protein [Streptomyces sp. AP-93]